MSRLRLVPAAAWAVALAAASFGAHAAPAFAGTFSFDDVASGSAANSALGSLASSMHFANPDIERDLDPDGGYSGGFHWIDATAVYGDIRVTASVDAVSGTNVLSNEHQPLMLVFDAPVDLTRFSIQQDLSGFGNPQAGGTHLAFLDATGHEMPDQNLYYTQGGQPGLLLQTAGVVQRVSGVLLAGGVDYDNLSLAAVTSAVPEPDAAALLLGGLGAMAWAARRRGKRQPGEQRHVLIDRQARRGEPR